MHLVPVTHKYVRIFFIIGAVLLISQTFYGQQSRKDAKLEDEEKYPAVNINIGEQLEIFRQDTSSGIYRVSLCADVPNNKKPMQVAHHQETGHVFVILQKIKPRADTLHRVFGFYPKKGLPTLFFKKISSRIKDNSFREYDVEISREISKEDFDSVITKAVAGAQRKYHINKYNCYDYALELFNTGGGTNALRVRHVRFPFIFGRGGSPVSVYAGLQELQQRALPWAQYVRFGDLRAPISTGRMK